MRSSEPAGGTAVRALAARLNAEIVAGGRSLEAVLAEAEGVAQRDRGLLRAMLSGSLRWHHRLEWQLERLLSRPLKRREATLAALLRVGLLQLQALRVPDHAAVSATVAATGALGLGRARGLVNAVLRRYLREREAIDAAMREHEVPSTSHPGWLIERIRDDWPDDWPRILAANNEQAPMWLRVNGRLTTRDAYLERLEAAGHAATPSARAPAALCLRESCPTASLPGFAEGLVSVQDAGAQLAAGLLALAPGQRVLDACAAPGGKTAHMLESCPGLAGVTALDLEPARLEQVAATLGRLGLDAELAATDASRLEDWWDGRPFERILIDAPCSATGVIRRHPDIKVLRRPDDLPALEARQASLLAALWPALAPGGLLVYATCSVLRRENEAQIDRFLAATPDASAAAYGSAGQFQVLPGEANMDGFYYASLTKQPES